MAPKNIREFPQKMRENQIFFTPKTVAVVFKFVFFERLLADRKSRRMYCRRRLPGPIGTQKFEAKKMKNSNLNFKKPGEKKRESQQKKSEKL